VCAGLGCCVSSKCVAAGSNCGTSSTSGICDSGGCRSASGTCGDLGSQSSSNCSSSSCYHPYATNDTSSCVPCGLLGQKCCGGYNGFCASGTSCNFDHCVTCGLAGQPCCAGGFCNAGSCSSNRCP
jgi:hypothetical protein